ncbi:hypothetical protein LR48_Vigan598s001800 [Vigna angularis]|uniref:Uncharacterized protein n=1 Tax=Phaseolus angularis TaxID=3914 RepID=A0A0L9TE88_PHAAN|nr:hypothetical protein LR48_Vigan598s001800 [Vigna angularis]
MQDTRTIRTFVQDSERSSKREERALVQESGRSSRRTLVRGRSSQKQALVQERGTLVQKQQALVQEADVRPCRRRTFVQERSFVPGRERSSSQAEVDARPARQRTLVQYARPGKRTLGQIEGRSSKCERLALGCENRGAPGRNFLPDLNFCESFALGRD